MPAKSRKQQRALYAKYGEDWVKRHHFNKVDPKQKPTNKKAKKR